MPSSESALAWKPWQPEGFAARPAARAAAARPAVAQEAPPAPQVKLPTAAEIEQMHVDAHKAGYAAGYEEGTARARREALQLHTVVEALDKALAAIDQEVAEELGQLAVDIARQVVRQTLAVTPEAVVEVVREALAQLPHQHAAIYLHPEDASLLRSFSGDQLTHAGHRIFEDAALTRGGVRIEAAGSTIDGTLETRWQRVLMSLGRSEPWQAGAAQTP